MFSVWSFLGARVEKCPELQVLVARDGRQRSAIRTETPAENTQVVCRGNVAGFLERGVVEKRNQVQREPVGGHHFEPCAFGVAPMERRNLRAGLDQIDARAAGGVPKVDGAVARPSARRKQQPLHGTPRQRLHRGAVGVFAEERAAPNARPITHASRASAAAARACCARSRVGASRVPNGHHVVVAAAGENVPVRAVLEAAHLGRVRMAHAHQMARHAHVAVADAAVFGARREHVQQPRLGGHTRARAHCEGPEPRVGLDVPDFHAAVVSPDRNVRPVVQPPQRCHGGSFEFAQKTHGASGGVPYVHGVSKTHGNKVGGRPCYKVEVEVVDNIGGVEHAVGRGRNLFGARRRCRGAETVVGEKPERRAALGRRRTETQDAQRHIEPACGSHVPLVYFRCLRLDVCLRQCIGMWRCCARCQFAARRIAVTGDEAVGRCFGGGEQ